MTSLPKPRGQAALTLRELASSLKLRGGGARLGDVVALLSSSASSPARYGPGMPDCLLPLTAARLDNVNGAWGSGVDPVYFTTSCRKCGGRRWVRG